MRLQVTSTEQAVGPFFADIICHEIDSGHTVVIENQLDASDHKHLGQLVTYAAGLHAMTVVWIARYICPDHRAALEWLNRISDPTVHFFGFEIEVVSDSRSGLTPRFKLVSSPDGWQTEVSSFVPRMVNLSESQQFRKVYAGTYKQHYLKNHAALLRNQIHPPSVNRHPWIRHKTDINGLTLDAMVYASHEESNQFVSGKIGFGFGIGEIYDANGRFLQQQATRIFEAVSSMRSELEDIIGQPLVWTNAFHFDKKWIYTSRDADCTDEDDWVNQFEWYMAQLQLFSEALRIIRLQLQQSLAVP